MHAAWAKVMKPEWAAPLLRDVLGSFRTIDWRAEVLKAEVERIGERYGANKSKSQAPVRVAITGRAVGPPLYESLELLGRETVLARLELARDRSA